MPRISTESPTLREFGPAGLPDDRRILFLEILGPPWAWRPENIGKSAVSEGLWKGLSRFGLDVVDPPPGTKCTITHLRHGTHTCAPHPTPGTTHGHGTPTDSQVHTQQHRTQQTAAHHTALHHQQARLPATHTRGSCAQQRTPHIRRLHSPPPLTDTSVCHTEVPGPSRPR